jgi:hypothetical protein
MAEKHLGKGMYHSRKKNLEEENIMVEKKILGEENFIAE